MLCAGSVDINRTLLLLAASWTAREQLQKGNFIHWKVFSKRNCQKKSKHLQVVLPTPPFPPTKIHFNVVWSMRFRTEASNSSLAITLYYGKKWNGNWNATDLMMTLLNGERRMETRTTPQTRWWRLRPAWCTSWRLFRGGFADTRSYVKSILGVLLPFFRHQTQTHPLHVISSSIWYLNKHYHLPKKALKVRMTELEKVIVTAYLPFSSEHEYYF